MQFLPLKPAKQFVSSASWLFAALMLGGIGYSWIAAWAGNSSGFSDAIDYLFMADFYSEWLQGYRSEEVVDYYRNTRFPPLFPLLLAFAGGDSRHIARAILVSCFIAVMAAASVGAWAQKELKDLRIAAWIALMLLWYPAYFILNLNLVSEPLAILLICLIFTLATQPTTPSILLIIALLTGISPLVRTATIPIIPALVIWLSVQHSIRIGWKIVAIAISAIPFSLWSLYRSLLGAESYMHSLRPNRVLATMGVWPDALWLLPQRISSAMASNWESPHSALSFIATALMALALPGLIIRLRNNYLDAWFLAGYAAMILIWPFPEETSRFLIVVYPILLLHAVVTARWLDAHWWLKCGKTEGASFLIFAAIITSISVTTMLGFANRAAIPVDPILLADKREAYFFRAKTDTEAVAAAEVVGRARILAGEAEHKVPKTACIYTDFPQFVTFYSRRRVVPFPANLTQAERAQRILQACDYFFLAGFSGAQTRRGKLYPHRALEGWTQPILVSIMLHQGKPNTAAVLLTRKSSSNTLQ